MRVEREITEASTWNEEQQPGLGTRFIDYVDQSLNRIASHPYQYPARYEQELHVAPLKTFPYLVIYWVDEVQNTVFVTSVFHTSRKPKKF